MIKNVVDMANVKSFLLPIFLSLLLILSSQVSFLLFHTLAEAFAIFVALLTAVVAWQMYSFNRNHFLMFLGCGYFWVAMLDVVHTLSYKGLEILPVSGPNISVQFWISTRFLEATLLLAAPFFLSHGLRHKLLFSLFGLGSLIVVAVIMAGLFPTGFEEGKGLTPFKITSEYIIIGVIGCAIYLLSRQRHLLDKRVYVLIVFSMFFTMLAELAFTFYISIYDVSNLAGHILKFLSFWLIFIAVVRTTLRDPFSALSKAETHYDAVPDATIIVDLDGVIQHVNNSACLLTGKTNAELIGKASHSVFHSQYDDVSTCPVCQSIVQKREISALEMEIEQENWREYTTSLLESDDCFIEVIRDISSKKKLESLLVQSQAVAKLGSWELDLTSNELIWSDEVYRIFGLDKNSSTPSFELFIEHVHPDDRIKVRTAYENSVKNRHDAYEVQHRIIEHGTNTLKVILEKCINIKNKNGEVIRSIGIAHDVTDLISAQQLVIKQEMEQRDILNSMVDAVMTINERGIVLTFNHASEKLFGYQSSEIIGKKVNQLMPSSYADHHDSFIHNYMTTGDRKIIGIGREVQALSKDGKVIPIRLSVAELPDDEEGNRRFIGSCLDLTILKNQEEQLRRSQKMDALGKLTGGVAHDYNNMLGVILGYAELLEHNLKDDPKLKKYSHEITRAGKRGASLTKKLLGFSKQTTSSFSPTDINNLINSQQLMLEKTLTVRIKLVLDLSNHLWPVWVDQNDLEDVILNMSINAMHAIKRNGILTISTQNQKLDAITATTLGLQPGGDYVMLTISDTGEGIDEKLREKIFDPFFTTKGELGTGLGLSQAYGFIKRCGGAIDVVSESGIGTQFILYFPRHLSKSELEDDGTDRPSQELKGTESILVVDDEPSLGRLALEILSNNGYYVEYAESAVEALELLHKKPFDLVISDVLMPITNGYQLADQIRKKYPSTKLIMASGYTDVTGNIDTIEELTLLHKPYKAADLLSKIRQELDKQ